MVLHDDVHGSKICKIIPYVVSSSQIHNYITHHSKILQKVIHTRMILDIRKILDHVIHNNMTLCNGFSIIQYFQGIYIKKAFQLDNYSSNFLQNVPLVKVRILLLARSII